MIDIDDKLWLQYIQTIEKHNLAQYELNRKTALDAEEELKAEYKTFANLPWHKRIFRAHPRQARPRIPLRPFILKPSIDGYLTWKAKNKKL